MGASREAGLPGIGGREANFFVSPRIRLKFHTHQDSGPGRLCTDFQKHWTGDGRGMACRNSPGTQRVVAVSAAWTLPFARPGIGGQGKVFCFSMYLPETSHTPGQWPWPRVYESSET